MSITFRSIDFWYFNWVEYFTTCLCSAASFDEHLHSTVERILMFTATLLLNATEYCLTRPSFGMFDQMIIEQLASLLTASLHSEKRATVLYHFRKRQDSIGVCGIEAIQVHEEFGDSLHTRSIVRD